METLEQRLAEVRRRIARAADRARRDPAGILLLAVTKVFPARVTRDAYALGLREFGENYVQEMESKLPEIARSGRRAIPPDRPLAEQQERARRGDVSLHPDG